MAPISLGLPLPLFHTFCSLQSSAQPMRFPLPSTPGLGWLAPIHPTSLTFFVFGKLSLGEITRVYTHIHTHTPITELVPAPGCRSPRGSLPITAVPTLACARRFTRPSVSPPHRALRTRTWHTGATRPESMGVTVTAPASPGGGGNEVSSGHGYCC